MCFAVLIKMAPWFAENGQVLYLWVGFQTPANWLQAVLGVGDYAHVDPNMVCMATGPKGARFIYTPLKTCI
jgi:hypothetical protein